MSVLRCQGCARVRYGGPWTDWENHPGKLEDEKPGWCATCFQSDIENAQREYIKNVRRTVRRQAHKEPWAEGTAVSDPFKNMREPQS